MTYNRQKRPVPPPSPLHRRPVPSPWPLGNQQVPLGSWSIQVLYLGPLSRPFLFFTFISVLSSLSSIQMSLPWLLSFVLLRPLLGSQRSFVTVSLPPLTPTRLMTCTIQPKAQMSQQMKTTAENAWHQRTQSRRISLFSFSLSGLCGG